MVTARRTTLQSEEMKQSLIDVICMIAVLKIEGTYRNSVTRGTVISKIRHKIRWEKRIQSVVSSNASEKYTGTRKSENILYE